VRDAAGSESLGIAYAGLFEVVNLDSLVVTQQTIRLAGLGAAKAWVSPSGAAGRWS
jgi:hypothetical protein